MNYNKFTKSELIAMLAEREKRNIGNTPATIWETIKHYGLAKQEYFIVVMLDGAHNIIKHVVVSMGLINRTLAHPREVFAPAIENRATAIIIAHNHPSGNLDPSPDDLELTFRLKKAGDILGVPVLDHIVFSACNFHSMCEAGEIIS